MITRKVFAAKTARLRRAAPRALAALFFLAAVGLIGACGRAGMPQPPSSSKVFTWEKVGARMAGDCILFEGVFTGAYEYFNGVRLEVARLSGPDDCVGCPFVPQEVTELSPGDAGFDPDRGAVLFTYCPRKAGAYRWRLAGMSSFSRLPHATMIDRLLIAGDTAASGAGTPQDSPAASGAAQSSPAPSGAASASPASSTAADAEAAPAPAPGGSL